MKLSDGTELDNCSIERLVKLRDELNNERLRKLADIKQKQLLIIDLQNEVAQTQDEAILLGDDVIAILNKLEDAIKKAQANN